MSAEKSAFVAASADVADEARILDGAKVWHLAQIREDAVIGHRAVVGRGAYIGTGVQIGDDSKIQNYALVYEPAVVEDGVFIGPAAVLTNDTYPRAVAPDGGQKSTGDWEAVGVTVKYGASVGARAVCVAPVSVGRWAMIAAGSVVVKDVPDYALMAGVPARQIGWVGPAGRKLRAENAEWVCPETGHRFVENNGELEMGEQRGV